MFLQVRYPPAALEAVRSSPLPACRPGRWDGAELGFPKSFPQELQALGQAVAQSKAHPECLEKIGNWPAGFGSGFRTAPTTAEPRILELQPRLLKHLQGVSGVFCSQLATSGSLASQKKALSSNGMLIHPNLVHLK